MISRRREERTTVSVPIRIWGMDANGKPFSVPATTHDLTRFGARIMGVRVPLTPGEIVGVQHGSEKTRFRVAWYGRPGSRLEGNVGLQALDWKKHIWGSLIQDSAPTIILNTDHLKPGETRYASGIDPLLERMDAESDLAPTRPPTPAPVPPSRTALARLAAAERRLATRYTCGAAAEITDPRTGETHSGNLREMSLVGCFIYTGASLPHRAAVNIAVHPFGMTISCAAQVRHIENGTGFGVKFTQVTETEREKLQTAIERLAEEGAPVANQSGAPSRASLSRAEQIVSTVDRLTAVLRDLDSLAARSGGELDARLLRSLRTHSEQIRQAAFAVQQWLEFRDGHKDTAPLLTEAENRRLRASISLLRELLSETEAESFSFDRPAVSELYAAAVAVYRRLAWIAERRNPASTEK